MAAAGTNADRWVGITHHTVELGQGGSDCKHQGGGKGRQQRIQRLTGAAHVQGPSAEDVLTTMLPPGSSGDTSPHPIEPEPESTIRSNQPRRLCQLPRDVTSGRLRSKA